jgi:hypothetical protein
MNLSRMLRMGEACFQIIFFLVVILIFAFSGFSLVWMFYDDQKPILFGDNGFSKIIDSNLVIFQEAVTLRECSMEVSGEISECGSIKIGPTAPRTFRGDKVRAISIPMQIIRELIESGYIKGKMCNYRSKVKAYCNPLQKMLRIPITQDSPDVTFFLGEMERG